MAIRGGPTWRYAAPLVDQLCRPINYLRISVTDRCNLRCVHCMARRGLTIAGARQLSTSFWMLPGALDEAVIAGAMRALLARHDEKEEAELYPLAQAR